MPKPRIPVHLEIWIDARKKFRLSHAQVQMAREMGLNLRSSGNSRNFYEIEAIRNNWSARELERQINNLLYERLALSKDKEGLMGLAKKGQEIQRPVDVFKDPMVMEFLCDSHFRSSGNPKWSRR